MAAADPFDLSRFKEAQAPVWAEVLGELRRGRKTSHWMWFVFPQLASLGRSEMARRYGLSGLAEARAYAAHPVLGPRLKEACEILMTTDGDAVAIFGSVDAMKLRSCLTLFIEAAPDEPVYSDCLQHCCGGVKDPQTLRLLGSA